MPPGGNRRRTFIALGSNLGDRIANCLEAVRRISETGDVETIRLSSPYETEPAGIVSDKLFINAVLEVRTSLDPEVLLDLLLKIEQQMGRDRAAGPDRTIDLDILFMEGIITASGHTKAGKVDLPHPGAGERAFVLMPWAELAPDLVIEPWKKTVRQMLGGLPSMHPVLRRVSWEPERTQP